MSQPVVHITGARPNFPKAAPVIAGLTARGVPQLLVHTGQHYDDKLSDVFFRELSLPKPDVNLGVGSGAHGAQTANTMIGLEKLFSETPPKMVVVYGDVNSTVAAALVAAKMHIPVAHVEAGLRSFDMSMPEEVNRRLTDQLSDLLFVTSPEGIGYLANEGIDVDRIHFVGNPMIDTLLKNLDRLDAGAAARYGLGEKYVVATLHRPSNVDDPVKAKVVVDVLKSVAEEAEVIIPMHPRGKKVLAEAGIGDSSRIHVADPMPYTEFLGLVRGAVAVVTDSGGVQEETTILGVPCLTMRPNTERPITITSGTNQLVEPGQVLDRFREVMAAGRPDGKRVPPLWDGAAGERIADIIASAVQ